MFASRRRVTELMESVRDGGLPEKERKRLLKKLIQIGSRAKSDPEGAGMVRVTTQKKELTGFSYIPREVVARQEAIRELMKPEAITGLVKGFAYDPETATNLIEMGTQRQKGAPRRENALRLSALLLKPDLFYRQRQIQYLF